MGRGKSERPIISWRWCAGSGLDGGDWENKTEWNNCFRQGKNALAVEIP